MTPEKYFLVYKIQDGACLAFDDLDSVYKYILDYNLLQNSYVIIKGVLIL